MRILEQNDDANHELIMNRTTTWPYVLCRFYGTRSRNFPESFGPKSGKYEGGKYDGRTAHRTASSSSSGKYGGGRRAGLGAAHQHAVSALPSLRSHLRLALAQQHGLVQRRRRLHLVQAAFAINALGLRACCSLVVRPLGGPTGAQGAGRGRSWLWAQPSSQVKSGGRAGSLWDPSST